MKKNIRTYFKKVCEAIKNFCTSRYIIYLISVTVSFILVYVSTKLNQSTDIYWILMSVGCGVFSAAAMAIFIDIIDKYNREQQKIKLAKQYLYDLYDNLQIYLQNILWFEHNLNNNKINWELSSEKYFCLPGLVYLSKEGENIERTYSQSEFISHAKEIASKYSLSAQKNMDEAQLLQVQKVFNNLYTGGLSLLQALKNLEIYEPVLISNEILSYDELKNIKFSIQTSIVLFSKKDKNYETSITSLLRVIEIIAAKAKLSSTYEIKITGKFSPTEL